MIQCNAVVWSFLASFWFFSTGHQCTIPSIRFDAGFIGLQGDTSVHIIRGMMLTVFYFCYNFYRFKMQFFLIDLLIRSMHLLCFIIFLCYASNILNLENPFLITFAKLLFKDIFIFHGFHFVILFILLKNE